MEATSKKFKTVDEYLSALSQPEKGIMIELRKTIRKAAPGAEEVISYNMAAFKLHGMLVWYAGYKKHIGFYPAPRAIEAFKKELSAYKGAKGSVQFPLDEPLPFRLITKIVKYRVKENLKKSGEKAARARR